MKKIATYSISFREPMLAYALPEVGYLQKDSVALRSGLNAAAVVEQHPTSGICCAFAPNLAKQQIVYLTSTTSTSRSLKVFSLKDSVIYCSVFSVVADNFIIDQTNLVLQK